MSVVAIVPAAGRAERFGGAKLLAEIRGEPLLNWTLWSLLDGGVTHIVVVSAPGADLSPVRLLGDKRVLNVVNDNPARGMFSSIQTGLAVASGDPILILPGDMPFINSSTVTSVITACIKKHRVIVPMHDGERGHPIAIPGHLRDQILASPVEWTLKDALAAAGVDRDELHVPDPGVVRDVDTKEDL